jgi:Protein of unknown function (DUF2971)
VPQLSAGPLGRVLKNMKPDTLYKYRSFDESNIGLRLLTHNELWFASGVTFNDPFDSTLGYTFDSLYTRTAEKWVFQKAAQFMQDKSPEERKKFADQRLSEMRDPKKFESERSDMIKMNQDKFGICSLSALNDDLLMWGHYAHKHQGFCVGLSVQHLTRLQFSLVGSKDVLDIEKVKYRWKIPRKDFFKSMLGKRNVDDVKDFMIVKYRHWKYEKEYRLVLWDHTNFNLHLLPGTITSLYLGCKISDENRTLVIQLARSLYPNIPVYQAKTNMDRFKLDFIKIQ